MKLSIDLEEFWIDEDGERLSDQLRDAVSYSVVTEIRKNIKDLVDKEVKLNAEEAIKSRLGEIIESRIAETINQETIIIGREEITISEYIKRQFKENSSWSPNSEIKRIAREFGEELKVQYNNAFANHIVKNMKEQGLLKDEVVLALLEGENEKRS